MTPAGLRLLDFEGATVYHALFDAATLTLPFPSCWCHDALPAALRAELLDRYCDAYGRDDVEDELARVSIVWSAWVLTRHLGTMRESDFVFRPELVSGRQRVRAAAQTIAAVAAGATQDWAARLDAELGAAWGESTDRRPRVPAVFRARRIAPSRDRSHRHLRSVAPGAPWITSARWARPSRP